MYQFPLQTLLTFSGWIGRARGCQPTIEFLPYQSRLFQQSDYFVPNDLIQELLSDEAGELRGLRSSESCRINLRLTMFVSVSGLLLAWSARYHAPFNRHLDMVEGPQLLLMANGSNFCQAAGWRLPDRASCHADLRSGELCFG